jgi:hypothetical protein
MVTSVFSSAETQIPMSLEERLGVGFVENGKLRTGLCCGARCFQMSTEAFPREQRLRDSAPPSPMRTVAQSAQINYHRDQ